ncbi:MAG: hypothetical protein I8H76_07145 [Burkholderiales bacterium]|nr:hypothetical protein [Burkholderiales bacterium]MBH2015761.1 hypothetical protein [Burkholderiales bacterium]
MTHPLQWTSPQAYWRIGPQARQRPELIAQPQILRFATDDFMDQFLSTLSQEPMALPEFTAQYETWRQPHVGPQANPQAWQQRAPSRLLPLTRKMQAHALARQGLPALPEATPPSALNPIKLYQAAHQRHYLIAGSLVCQAPGLPDRAINPGTQKVSVVLRRLQPTHAIDTATTLPAPTDLSQWQEHAWVPGAGAEAGQWQPLPADNTAVLPKEERLSTFPARYTDPDGQARRLFVGSVPVGRRETYQAAPMREPDAIELPPQAAQEKRAQDARIAQLQSDALAPWRALVNIARDLQMAPSLSIYQPGAFDDQGRFQGDRFNASQVAPAQLRRLRSQLQLSTWYTLLDLRQWLADHLPNYLSWLDEQHGGQAVASEPPGGASVAAFHAALQRVRTPDDLINGPLGLLSTGGGFDAEEVAADLPDALHRIGQASVRDLLENALTGSEGHATQPFEIPPPGEGGTELSRWPRFLFMLVDPWSQVPAPTDDVVDDADYPSERAQAGIGGLARLVPKAALTLTSPVPAAPLATTVPTDMREAWYVMRLVYERPDCQPFEGSVLSAPSVPFQMAGFFDPDAPARPIRIGLPLDISPAGLRKFDRNTVFMMSDMLCGHIDRFKGITFGDLVLSVLPWPFHKDFNVSAKGPCKEGGDPLGVMCSLSIPIITICALILLTIIVSLLDFIFRWLPLFVVCFPVPGFKGRKGS